MNQVVAHAHAIHRQALHQVTSRRHVPRNEGEGEDLGSTSVQGTITTEWDCQRQQRRSLDKETEMM